MNLTLGSKVLVQAEGSELDGREGQIVQIVNTDIGGEHANHTDYPKYRVSMGLRGAAFVFYHWELVSR